MSTTTTDDNGTRIVNWINRTYIALKLVPNMFLFYYKEFGAFHGPVATWNVSKSFGSFSTTCMHCVVLHSVFLFSFSLLTRLQSCCCQFEIKTQARNVLCLSRCFFFFLLLHHPLVRRKGFTTPKVLVACMHMYHNLGKTESYHF
jgi:hypothetical protein